MDDDAARTLALDAAEESFYARGIQAVGMDELRDRSGLSLRRLYGLFPAKEGLVVAFLERRDERWRGRLAAHVEAVDDPEERLLAVFDWLRAWFEEPGFRGCAWINTYGELGASRRRSRPRRATTRSASGPTSTAWSPMPASPPR